MTIIELNYHCHDTAQVDKVVQLHWPSSGYLHLLKNQATVLLVKHLQHKGHQVIDGVPYHFFNNKNRFWYIPFVTHRFIKRQQPDIVLVQGLVFPLQVIVLKWLLGKRTLLVSQHHGEQPWRGIKGWFQRRADKCIAAYTFTALDNAVPWLKAGIIAHQNKCVEVLEAAPDIEKQDRETAKQKNGVTGNPSFLWVGRLNSNKDPITVLSAFQDYLAYQPAACLYMLYHQAGSECEQAVRAMLQNNPLLAGAVKLIGEVDKTEMAWWYSATDFYITASHREGSGYALLEAMHCGCIPIVTNIPTFLKITAGGKWGFLYKPGSPEDLLRQLLLLQRIDKIAFSADIIAYAHQQLTHQSIAHDVYALCEQLVGNEG